MAERSMPSSSDSRCAATVLKNTLGSAVEMGGVAKAVLVIKRSATPQSKTLSLPNLWAVRPKDSIPETIMPHRGHLSAQKAFPRISVFHLRVSVAKISFWIGLLGEFLQRSKECKHLDG